MAVVEGSADPAFEHGGDSVHGGKHVVFFLAAGNQVDWFVYEVELVFDPVRPRLRSVWPLT